MNKKVSVGTGLPWRFTDKRFTAWGGLRIFDELLRRLDWAGALRSAPLPQPGSNRGYDPALITQAFLLTIWTGGGRFAHTALVRFDEALRAIFGLAEVPSVSTFTRFFRRFGQREVDEVFGHLSRWFWDRLSAQTWTIDLDSSVLTRYGHQEGSQRGYNPRRRGKRSHHPLMAFAAECRMVVTAWLRPGNTTDANNVENFFGEVLATLGGRHRVGLMRGDSGFCIGTLFDVMEEKKIDYVVVARMPGTLKRQIAGLKNWVEVDRGVAVAECEYHAQGWSRPRRVVAVRHRRQDRPQGQTLLEVPGYSYAVYVTSLRLPPEQVRRLYLGRADSENRIKELLQDFALSGFTSEKFWATEAAFRMALCAYNLMSLFRQALLGTASNQTLSTLRVQCFAIGASLGRAANKQLLRLGLPPPRRQWFEGLFSSAQQITTPCLG
jgi:Transposase DDE domain group 1